MSEQYPLPQEIKDMIADSNRRRAEGGLNNVDNRDWGDQPEHEDAWRLRKPIDETAFPHSKQSLSKGPGWIPNESRQVQDQVQDKETTEPPAAEVSIGLARTALEGANKKRVKNNARGATARYIQGRENNGRKD